MFRFARRLIKFAAIAGDRGGFTRRDICGAARGVRKPAPTVRPVFFDTKSAGGEWRSPLDSIYNPNQSPLQTVEHQVNLAVLIFVKGVLREECRHEQALVNARDLAKCQDPLNDCFD